MDPFNPAKRDSFNIGINELVDGAEDPPEASLQEIWKDSTIWVAGAALVLLIALAAVQILGLARAVSANGASAEPMVSWCSPIFQPFGVAVLDGNRDLYSVQQSFTKGIGCIKLPGARQKSWLKATVAGISLGLIFEAIDIGILAIVHGGARWRGVKMRRPWFTMFGGLAVLGVILICGIMYASSLPSGITERVWVVTKAGPACDLYGLSSTIGYSRGDYRLERWRVPILAEALPYFGESGS